jgi:hypothetical protein
MSDFFTAEKNIHRKGAKDAKIMEIQNRGCTGGQERIYLRTEVADLPINRD